MKKKVLLVYVPVFPKTGVMFPCSPRYFPFVPFVPLFPKTPGRPSSLYFWAHTCLWTDQFRFSFFVGQTQSTVSGNRFTLVWKAVVFSLCFVCSCCGLIVLWALFSLLTSSVSLKGPHNENEARKLSNNHYFGTFKICVLTTLQTQWIWH